jgi:RNA polymerase II subunit A small phosphatase-like protein
LDSQGRPARKRSLLDGQQQFGVTNNNYDGTQSSVTQAEPATAAAPTAARRNSAGRRRTGSGSSGIRAARAQHAQGDKSTQSTPTTDRSTAKPKKKGVSRFLALLGCCGAESTEDNVDDNTQEAKRIQKPRPTQPMQAQPVVTKEETPVAPPMATEVRDTAPPVVESSYQQAPITSSEKQIVAPLAPSQLDTSSSQPGNFNEKSTYSPPSEPVSSAQRNLDKSLPATPNTISTSRATAPRMHRTESERHAAQVAAWPPTPLVNEEPISEDDEDIINDRTPEQAKIDEDLELSEAQPAVPIAPHEVVPVPAVVLPPEIRRQSTDRPGLRRGEASSIVNSAPLPPPPTERQSNPPVSVVHAEPQQKWLLPPVRPEHKGRKCLVLDLDETLVHSSFKVSEPLLSYLRFHSQHADS